MTTMGKLVALFPAVHVVAIVGSIWQFTRVPNWIGAACIFFMIYGFPVLLFRLHNWICPLKVGEYDLMEPVYSAWWGSHQFQLLFLAVPSLERILALIPGLFSSWLRLWGSDIGKGVHWSPTIEILDRGALVIGDYTVVGHACGFYPHYIRRNAVGKLVLYYNKITVGSQCLLGAKARFAPGVVIGEKSRLNILSDIYPDVKISAGYKSVDREIIKTSV